MECDVEFGVTLPRFKAREARPGQLYFPHVGDHVIGVVVAKNSDFYTLDIGAIHEATLLSVEGFRGATKRNRPNLSEGDIIFCQVIRQYPKNELPTEVTCCHADDVKQWATKETYFGPLTDGFTFSIPLIYSFSLSEDSPYVLKLLASRFKYEVAVGLNGRIWVKGRSDEETLLVARFVRLAYGATRARMEAMMIANERANSN